MQRFLTRKNGKTTMRTKQRPRMADVGPSPSTLVKRTPPRRTKTKPSRKAAKPVTKPRFPRMNNKKNEKNMAPKTVKGRFMRIKGQTKRKTIQTASEFINKEIDANHIIRFPDGRIPTVRQELANNALYKREMMLVMSYFNTIPKTDFQQEMDALDRQPDPPSPTLVLNGGPQLYKMSMFSIPKDTPAYALDPYVFHPKLYDIWIHKTYTDLQDDLQDEVKLCNMMSNKCKPPVLKSYVASYLSNYAEVSKINSFLIIQVLKGLLDFNKTCKFSINILTHWKRFDGEIGSEDQYIPYHSKQYIFTKTISVFQMKSLIEQINKNCFEWERESLRKFESSDMRYVRVLSYDINISIFNPLRGAEYFKIPEYLSNKKAIINVQNRDNRCFLYAIASALMNVDKNANRAKQYDELVSTFNIDDIDMPMVCDDEIITKFEDQNKELLKGNRINVLQYFKDEEGHYIEPVRTSDRVKDNKAINIIYVEDDNEEEEIEKSHYCWVKSMSRLFGDQISGNKNKTRICNNCLSYHTQNEEIFAKHVRDCKGVNTACQIQEFRKGNLEFTSFNDSVKVPYVIYADFEAVLKNVNDNTNSNTTKTQQHVPCGYMLLCVGPDGQIFRESLYRGRNHMKTMKRFFRDIKRFQYAVLQAIPKPKQEKTKPPEIPLFFHNGNRYDTHIVINYFAKLKQQMKIDGVIMRNSQNFISFKLGNIVFKDSIDFLNGSLDKVSKSLSKDDYKLTKLLYPNQDEFKMMIRKGVYPYEYMNSFKRFRERVLPPKEAFHSKLTGCGISDNEYERACDIWTKFKCRNMGDYHDLYLKTDVYLLADIFENFRNKSYQVRGLDPCHSYTLPGYSWKCLLKESKAKLPYIPDSNMHMFLERGLRGGLTQVVKRKAEGNLLYVDANNLYGWAMVQKLPYAKFKMDEKTFEPDQAWIDKFQNIAADSNTGTILEVDVDYPDELHDAHSDLPMLVEAMEVQTEEITPFLKKILEKSGDKHIVCRKLVPNLKNKRNYVLHYRMLQFVLRHGLVLKKVHRVLEFKQKAWMADYINTNTKKRSETSDAFLKDFYKLSNNACFGKTMESVRKRNNTRIYNTKTDTKWLNKTIQSVNYEGCKQIDNLAFANVKKEKIVLDKPIYTGVAILDLSKLLMYEFFYDFLKPTLGDKVKLCYMDTDSFVLQLDPSIDRYEFMLEHKEYFDLSGIPAEHHMWGNRSQEEIKILQKMNKKVLGKFKDECNGDDMQEFIGLRPKMYAYKYVKMDGTTGGDMKAKGVNKSAMKSILFDHYNLMLENSIKVWNDEEAQTKMIGNINALRSTDQSIHSITQTKIMLSVSDDKRAILQDGTTTIPYGHYTLHEQ